MNRDSEMSFVGAGLLATSGGQVASKLAPTPWLLPLT